MKSKVENIIAYQDIPVAEDLMTIEIPSWEAVAKPLVDYGLAQYQEKTGHKVHELEDDHVAQLDLPVNTVTELKQYGVDVYQQSQVQYQFYNEILPFILRYYAGHTNVIANSEERDAYVQEYLEQVKAYADQAGLSVEDYGKQKMHITGDVQAEFERRAEEDFIFKLIALQAFERQGLSVDQEAYETFIQQNVVQSQADEIELREHFPYESFKKMMPEMRLSTAIYDHYVPQIKFVINPEAPLQFRE